MSDRIDGTLEGRERGDESKVGPPEMSRQFAVSVGTIAEVYHEIGNALSVIVPKLRLFRQHFEQVKELLTEFRSIDPGAPAPELKENILRCRKLAERDRGIDLHISKLTGAFEPCFKELEIIRIASEKLRMGNEDDQGGASAQVRPPIDACEELGYVVSLFEDHLKEVEGIRISLAKGHDEDDSSVWMACPSDELSYIVKNLVRNAVDAINERRRLGGYMPGEEPHIQLETFRNDSYARITCRDNGIGMDKELKKKIFDPFFTTKSRSKGTGVGLSIVKEIIERRSGKIEVWSEEGKGTVFIVDLPLCAGSGDGK
ncbi:MAG: HAMP domain-containing histidine kinase [Candidatus Coatesbacteria bacterium]|nr:HAMP domain-containing histidine kinase [Candidatus Coatesbacteria bacterium]